MGYINAIYVFCRYNRLNLSLDLKKLDFMNLNVIEIDSAPLKTILTPEVVTFSPDVLLKSVLALMEERSISSVVAVDNEDRPVGIFTEQDAIRLMVEKKKMTGLLLLDVMSQPVLTAPPNMGYGSAYQLMSEHNVRHLVVVDNESGKLIGLVSEGDFLHHMGMEYLVELKTVAGSMTSQVQTLDYTASLQDALVLMSKLHISCVVLTKKSKPIGILTERDMVRLASQDIAVADLSVADEMTSPLQTVKAEMPLQMASHLMEKSHIRRLVVVSNQGELAGILTRHDIAKSLQGSYIEYLQETLERKNKDLRHTEARLRDVEQKTFYQSLVEQISDAIFVIDADDGRILDANTQAARNLRMDMSELLELRVIDFSITIPSLDLWLDKHIPLLREKGELLIKTAHKRKDGTTYPTEVKARLVSFGMKEYVVAVARDLTEREEANKLLKESEQRFQALFENAPLAYQSLDMEGNIQVVNKAWLQMLKCSRDEVLGKPFRDFLTPHSTSLLQEEFPRFIDKGAVDGPLFELPRQGEQNALVRVTGQLGVEPVTGELRTHCMLIDVTENETTAATLRKSENRFRRFFMESPVAMAYVDPAGDLISLNDQFTAVFGYTPDDLPNMAAWFKVAYKATEQRTYAEDHWWKAVDETDQNGGLITPYEHAITCKRHRLKTVRFSGMRMENGFLVILEDITEQKKATKALKDSAETYFGVISTALDGFWMADMHGKLIDVNESYVRMSGFTREELLGMHIQDLDAIEAPNETRLRIERIISQGGERFLSQHRRKEGTVFDVEVNCTYWEGSGGRFFVFLRDVTQRKLDEDKLRQAAAVFGNTNEGVMITDPTGVIQMVNGAFCHLTGYTENEVLNKPASMLNSGRHDYLFYQTMWDAILETGSWQGEIWNRRKDGTTYPELLSISAVSDDEGVLSHYVGVFADISRLKESEDKLAYLAHHDMLTDLPNRLMLQARLEGSLSTAKRQQSQLALLLLDLDRFKDVNDSFGHAAGDELLIQVAKILQQTVREADSVCRMGGDEFAILLDGIHRPEDAGKVAYSIITALSKTWTLSNGCNVAIGASIGISIYPTQSEDAEALLQHADAALYRAKAEGRGRFQYFTEELTRDARNRLDLEARLVSAIANDELVVYYQPQINIQTGAIIGAEALVRWLDPERGLIPPIDFIPLAEQTGLIKEIGAYVLKESCVQAQSWIEQGFNPISMAVNLSAVQLRHSDIKRDIEEVLNVTGLPPAYLELEITESALMEREQESIDLLNDLRDLGVRIAIDDFGTGYSSLAYLKKFSLDVLKIDKSFVDDIPQDKDDMVIASTIVAMAHSLGLDVLAEGVETDDQLSFLASKDCDFYQGFLTSKPVPAEVFREFLEKESESTSFDA